MSADFMPTAPDQVPGESRHVTRYDPHDEYFTEAGLPYRLVFIDYANSGADVTTSTVAQGILSITASNLGRNTAYYAVAMGSVRIATGGESHHVWVGFSEGGNGVKLQIPGDIGPDSVTPHYAELFNGNETSLTANLATQQVSGTSGAGTVRAYSLCLKVYEASK